LRKNALAASGVALVLALSGCGARTIAGTPSADPMLFGNAQELVRAASAKTGQAKSAKFSVESSLAGQQVTGQGMGRFDGDNTAMQMTMNVGTVNEELRYVDKTLYIQLPEQVRAQMTRGKPWGKVPADSDLGKMMGASQAQQNDPSKILDQIQAAGTITRNEQTTLDRQQVTHYWINVDLAKAAGKLAASGISTGQLDQIKNKLPTIPLELWLNGDLLPVQFTENLSGMLTAAGAPASAQNVKMTMRYSGWGTAVDVQAPPADQVGELTMG
jgi:hypothetical protein